MHSSIRLCSSASISISIIGIICDMKMNILVKIGCLGLFALVGLGLEARSFEVKAWRGETVTTLLPDFCELAVVPKGMEISEGHLELVKYAPNPGSLERREAYDRVVWEGKDEGKPRIVEIKVPRDTPAGVYKCGMMNVTVVDRVLPDPKEWQYYLDLWQHPWAIARYAKVAPFSNEHFDAMRPVYKLLASAGQKTITVPILDEPWDHQCRDAYHSLVEDPDFSLFDTYVNFCLACGLGPDISCYSLCPWKLKVSPGSPEFEEYWGGFLVRFAAHLKEKGWFEHTYMAMDERAPLQVKAVREFIDKYAPGLKVSMAGNCRPSDFKDIRIDNYSQLLDYVTDGFLAESRKRHEEGLKTTLYTCCSPATPNTFVGSNPYEAFWLGVAPGVWGLDGYLRWAFCSWGENPVKDASFGNWHAGDTFLAYPNGEASIRFLELRSGIIAAEKLRILREEGVVSPEDEAELAADFKAETALKGKYWHQAIKDKVNRLVNR